MTDKHDLQTLRAHARRLLRAVSAGDPTAHERAAAVLGPRLERRFVHADALHVVAREQGAESWPALVAHGRRDAIRAALDEELADDGTAEVEVDTGLVYPDGAPVLVTIRRRGSRLLLDDGGGAISRSGCPRGWAERAARATVMNVSPATGAVFVPAVDRSHADLEGLAGRLAQASLDVLEAVLELDEGLRMWKPTAHADEEVARFRERREEAGIKAVVCHALYLVNLAGADRDLRRKSVAAMRASMETAAAIGADGVVFHVGSHLGKGLAAGYKRAVPALRELLELTDERLWLVLENSAGAGGTIGRSIDELAALVGRLDGHERLGICLDSCHWWVSGIDVTNPDSLDAAIEELDESIGIDRLRCLHVNDAGAALGSNRDRHASLGLGEMKDGLATFVAHPAFDDLPAILETHGPDGGYESEMRLLRELHRKGRRRLAARKRAKAR